LTAAIFGLVGVVVGALVNGAVAAWRQRVSARSKLLTAARLVQEELVRYRSLALAASRRPPEELPQLQHCEPVVWQSNRAVLAWALDDDVWRVIARAYAGVDALVSVLVFGPGLSLEEWRSREAQRLLTALVEPVEKAAAALAAVCGVPLELPEFPDEDLIAA
jgi:hypothetical protein